MQHKHEKLPYVFVELDETEDSEVLKPYIYDNPPYGYAPAPGAYPPYPGGAGPYVPERPYMDPYATPYSQASSHYPYPPEPYAATPQDDDDLLYDYDPDTAYDLLDDGDIEDMGVIEDDSPAPDYAEAEDPFDDDDLEVDSYEDDKSDVLDLKTVVVPVFKNMQSAKGSSGALVGPQSQISPQAPAMPAIQNPAVPIPGMQMPAVYQSSPFAMNPYGMPIASSPWVAQSLASIPMYPTVGKGPIPPIPQLAMSGIPGISVPSKSDPSNMRDMHQGGRQNDPKADTANSAQGRSAAPQYRTTSPSRNNASALTPNGQKGFASSSTKAAEISKNMPSKGNSTIVIGPDEATSGQTITTNTDSVSVSVKVMPPKGGTTTSVQSPIGMAQANIADTNGLQSARAGMPVSPQGPKASQAQGASQGRPITDHFANAQSQAPKRQGSEAKPVKETFEEKAMRENAEKNHAKFGETSGPEQVGKPLLDANAIETSDMFSAPATSMNESMKGFFRASRIKRTLLIGFLALIVAAIVAAVVCMIAIWSGAATLTYDSNNMPQITLSEDFMGSGEA